jgi:phosphoserine phosphatase
MNFFITASSVMAMAAQAFAEHLSGKYRVPLRRASFRTSVLDLSHMDEGHRTAFLDSVSTSARDLRLDTALLRADHNWSSFSVLASDMDSTLITIECIDEIADFCGKKDEVAAITEATMRGEIADFAESLKRRVALLAGTPEEVLEKVYQERLRLTEGAERLIDDAKSHQLKTLLVSGGFTFFTDRLKDRLKLDRAFSNVLGLEQGVLTGALQGEIFGARAKRQALLDMCAELHVDVSRSIAIGDGANDLPMMEVAGLSIAFHAKPAVEKYADVAVRFGGLDVIAEWL